MQPDPSVLSSLDDPPELRGELCRYADLVEEALSFGTHLFSSILSTAAESADESKNTALPVAALQFRWFLELLGGLSAQFRFGWAEPSAITIRSLFESSVGFHYMIADANKTVARTRAYLYMTHRRHIDFIDSIDPATERGKQYVRAMNTDEFFGAVAPPAFTVGDGAERDSLKKTLESPAFASTHAAYEALGVKWPEWYWFDSGPRSIEQLGQALRRTTEYAMYYRLWSRTAHSHDVVSGKLGFSKEGRALFAQLRMMNSLHASVSQTITLSLYTFTLAIRFICPGQGPALTEWHKSIRADAMRPPCLVFEGGE